MNKPHHGSGLVWQGYHFSDQSPGGRKAALIPKWIFTLTGVTLNPLMLGEEFPNQF